MLGKIKSIIDSSINRWLDNRRSVFAANSDNQACNADVMQTKLSKDEVANVYKVWGGIANSCTKLSIPYFCLIKHYIGFDARYLAGSVYIPHVCYALNPINTVEYFSHKGLLDLVCHEVPRPSTIIKSVGTVLLNSSNKICSLEEAVRNIAREEEPLILKLSTDSCMGLNIKKISPHSDNENIKTLLEQYKETDFVIQRFVKQSEQTAKFNSSSLNSFRITTFNVNNTASVGSRVIRFGAPDSFVDNIGGGSGGIMIGVDTKGILSNFGYDVHGYRKTSHNGINFGGACIDNFSKVEELALNLHSNMPNIGIIGWDIALDHNDSPVLIEANTIWPGIAIEQLCTGPIFGDRTEEVIDYVKHHPFHRKKIFMF